MSIEGLDEENDRRIREHIRANIDALFAEVCVPRVWVPVTCQHPGYSGTATLYVTGIEGKRPGDSCGICGTKLGVLLQSVYCPKDCDTPASVQARKERDEAFVQRVRDYNRANLDWYGKNPP